MLKEVWRPTFYRPNFLLKCLIKWHRCSMWPPDTQVAACTRFPKYIQTLSKISWLKILIVAGIPHLHDSKIGKKVQYTWFYMNPCTSKKNATTHDLEHQVTSLTKLKHGYRKTELLRHNDKRDNQRGNSGHWANKAKNITSNSPLLIESPCKNASFFQFSPTVTPKCHQQPQPTPQSGLPHHERLSWTMRPSGIAISANGHPAMHVRPLHLSFTRALSTPAKPVSLLLRHFRDGAH